MTTKDSLIAYRRDLAVALNNQFQRLALNNFAVAYPTGRAQAFTGVDIEALRLEIADLKDEAVSRLDQLFLAFKEKATAAGVQVHVAETAAQANEIIIQIAAASGVTKVVKGKSMTAEEIHLNPHLEAQGLEVTETDLGEWIIQLRREGPSHMVLPAIHLSRHQVAELFSEVTGQLQGDDVARLVKVARRELRAKFAQADMGITGANFAIAETGTIGLVTNEGNARLVATLPRVHVALIGLEKLTPNLQNALTVLKALPRNATGQAISSYVTWITGRNACAAAPDGLKQMHMIFLDNGRRALAKDPVLSTALRCIRCGACANVCPIYRLVGGHKYGHVYIGAIGLILTYVYHGRTPAQNLVRNCLNCGAC
ncbi:MAG: lactate utilization protein, partial [Deltaproteobacteria bacterium]|nr:lactate utilization protein [Deltaproteobacteria bacterium]